MSAIDKAEPAVAERVRRPVTVLFVDVVGSTSIAERLDPEEWADLMALIHRRIGAIVERHGGTVAQILGDGLLAFFGAPSAHEDDPVRAVRAGLDIVAAAREVDGDVRARHDVELALRVGVSTGPVVVGDVGAGGRTEYLAFGDAVNAAARIEAAASPMTVYVSAGTQRFVAPFFDVRKVGQLELRGKAEPVCTYQIIGPKSTTERDRGPGVATVMVGRSRELDELTVRSHALQLGEGGVVVIVGEPGIGKTRLVAEWRTRTTRLRPAAGPGQGRPLRWAEAHCTTEAAGVAYHAAAALVRALLDVPVTAGETTTRGALARAATDLAATAGIPYLAHLLGLPLSADEAAEIATLDPRGLQTQYVSATGQLLRARAEDMPLVVVIEDVQWIDPASADLLVRLLPATVEGPIVLSFTTRQDRATSGWRLVRSALETPGVPGCEVELGPLSPAESDALVDLLVRDTSVAQHLRSLVVARSEGNPFFLEEIVRTLLEGDEIALRMGAHPGAGGPAAPTRSLDAVPETLRGLLLARIDRLPPGVRRTLRAAAVIGRRFTVRLLEATLAEEPCKTGDDALGAGDRGAAGLLGRLDVLEASGLIDPVPGMGELQYGFRHALIQEAAYDELVRAERIRLHAMVGRAIERTSPERLDDLSAVLARHFAAAADAPRAVRYLVVAAGRAMTMFAHAEADRLLREALRLAEADEEIADTQAPGLHEQLGEVLTTIGQYAEAIEEFQRALKPEGGEAVDRARLHRRMAACLFLNARRAECARQLDAAMTSLGPAADDAAWWDEWIEVGLVRIWMLYFEADAAGLAPVIEAMREPVSRWATPVQRAQYLNRSTCLAFLTERFAMSDATVAACRTALAAAQECGSLSILNEVHFGLGLTLLLRLELDEAERELTTSARISARIGDDAFGCRSLNYLAMLERLRHNPAGVHAYLDQLEPRVARAQMGDYVASALANRAWLALREGDPLTSRALAEEALAGQPALGPLEFLARWPLAAIALAGDDVAEAVGQARALIAPTQYLLVPSVSSPLEAAVAAWDAGDADEAEGRLRRALAEAERVGYL